MGIALREYRSTTKLDDSITYQFYGNYEDVSYSPGPRLCYVIITTRSLFWTILTLMATFVITMSIITPQWLIGQPRWLGLQNDQTGQNSSGSVYDYGDRTYSPTLGLFNHCTKIHTFGDLHQDHCTIYVAGFHMPSDEFPDCWKSALILFALAILLLVVTCATSVVSLCIRSVFKKSIFTVSGLIQAIAGKRYHWLCHSLI